MVVGTVDEKEQEVKTQEVLMYRPLEGGKVVLVRVGAMSGPAMKDLANAMRCVVIPCHNPDDVRVLGNSDEPADRVAGMLISEEC